MNARESLAAQSVLRSMMHEESRLSAKALLHKHLPGTQRHMDRAHALGLGVDALRRVNRLDMEAEAKAAEVSPPAVSCAPPTPSTPLKT